MPDSNPQNSGGPNGANKPIPVEAQAVPAAAVAKPAALVNPVQMPVPATTPSVPLTVKPAQSGNGNGNGNGATVPAEAKSLVQPAAATPPSQPVVMAPKTPTADAKPAAPEQPATFKVASAQDQNRPSILQSLLFNKNLPVGSRQTSVPSLSALLGPKPVFSKAAFEEVEKKHEHFAQNVFKLSIVAMIGVFGFFYSQLNANFTWLGTNPAQKFEASNNELKSLKTKVNLINFRTAKYWLDEANEYVDPFQRFAAIAKSNFSTDTEKQNARTQIEKLGISMKNALGEVQTILNKPVGIATYSATPISPEQTAQEFEDLLKAELNKQRANIAVDPKLNSDELALFDSVIQFVGSKQFRNTVRAVDLKNISDEELGKIIVRIREQATDELSAIEDIRKKRLDWAEVINNIHAVTRRADPYYGQGAFKTLGGFLFNSYNFDSKTGKITISGVTKTSDSKTFSFIAKLVDSIEKSPTFKNIDFRSFSKSRDEIGDFSSSINLEFELQPSEEVDTRDDVQSSASPAATAVKPAANLTPAPTEPETPSTVTPTPAAPEETVTPTETPTENL